MTEKVFKVNTLRKMAEKYANQLTKSEEIFREDISDLLEEEVRYQIRNGEIVIIEIKAKPRMGKSAEGIFIGKYWIDDELKLCKKKDEKKEFGMKNIARDDQEYSKIMRNPKLSNDVVVTDEQNALEKGGENATTEQQLKEVFSDVQAGRYIHRVCISPESEIDHNSDILLEIVGIDSFTMTTHNRVYYRINNANNKYWQPIGYLNIRVRKLIQNWEKNVKDVFLKSEKTKKDIKFIEEQSKKDFFVYYMIKKYEKMELLTKEGILRPRELDYAEAVLNVVNKLKSLTKVMTIDDKLVRNYVELEFRKLRLVGSIVGIKLSADRVSGIINLYRNIEKTSMKRDKDLSTKKKMGIKEETIKKMKEEYNNIIDELKKAVKTQEDELKRYYNINKKYNEHLKQ